MKKQMRISVRLSDEEREDLERLSRTTGLPLSDLIRRAILAMIEYSEKHGGKLVLPLKFENNFKSKSKRKD